MHYNLGMSIICKDIVVLWHHAIRLLHVTRLFKARIQLNCFCYCEEQITRHAIYFTSFIARISYCAVLALPVFVVSALQKFE